MFAASFSETPGLEKLSSFQFAVAANLWAQRITSLVEAELKGHAPVGKSPDAGQFRDSIRGRHYSTAAGMTVEFSSNVPHAPFVIKGTRSHIIRPRNAKALYWVDPSGQDRFARLVHHPGTQPNPFVRRAVEPLLSRIEAELARAITLTLKG